MATEPHAASSTAPTWSDSPIENELPTYRAISTWAVASLVFGVVSIATFASLAFVIASLAAVVCGAIGLRAIRRYPDLLTGSGLANVGIALGLISGLSAPTVYTVQRSIIGRQAQAYGDRLAATMKDQGLAEAFWFAQHPAVRAEQTAQALMAEIESAQSGPEPQPPDERLIAFRNMSQRLVSSDRQHVHVDGIEGRGFTGTRPYALIRLMFDGPEGEPFPSLQFALLEVEGTMHEGKREWFVKNVTFPYEAGSRANVVESAHGHEH